MFAIILAAGMGSRLSDSNLPKPLTQLGNGKTLLAAIIDQLSNYLEPNKIIIVVGYHSEMIVREFPNCTTVYNPDFAKENTSKSLLRALNSIHDASQDVLWVNGDVVFHPTVLEKLLDKKKTGMVVNTGPVGEEEIKYRTDALANILEVSKHVKEPQGEALGINYFTAEDSASLKMALEGCQNSDYFEKAIEKVIESGIHVLAIPVDRSLCQEVDFPSDLEAANNMIASWRQ